MTYKALHRPSSTNLQIREYVDAAKKGKDSQFVVATEKGWTVRRATAKKITGTYPSKTEALAQAKKAAQKHNSEVYVFTKDGKLVKG